MNISYEHIENNYRSYHGISLGVDKCTAYLKGAVKDNLLDRGERQNMLDALKTLHQDTGFSVNNGLLADIQVLEDERMDLK